MRRSLGIIATFGLALLILIILGVAGNVELYRDNETELAPNRSSFNAGPTGTRAFYQLLEESQQRVSRWREPFRTLKDKAPNGIFVLVGPYANRRALEKADADALREWILDGGHALIISRLPQEQLGSLALRVNSPKPMPDWRKSADQSVNPKSDELIGQATRLTSDLRGLAFSDFAARLILPGQEKKEAQAKDEATASPSPSPTTTAAPSASPTATATPEESAEEDETEIEFIEESGEMILPAPVVHLGDEQGAVLADYDYGKGRIMVLTDPFVVANHGLARGANLQLTLNVLRELGADERPILFDEYHHGYRSETNALVGYFRGTPFWWVLGQMLLLTGLVIASLGKRFARPLPLPQADRHSPLEFVSSMASLQKAAEAHDLALENIYPKFKARLCRRLGLSVRAKTEDILKPLGHHPRFAPYAERLAHVINTSEQALRGAALSDHQLVALVSEIRLLNTEIK